MYRFFCIVVLWVIRFAIPGASSGKRASTRVEAVCLKDVLVILQNDTLSTRLFVQDKCSLLTTNYKTQTLDKNTMFIMLNNHSLNHYSTQVDKLMTRCTNIFGKYSHNIHVNVLVIRELMHFIYPIVEPS